MHVLVYSLGLLIAHSPLADTAIVPAALTQQTSWM
jgi:hypothetical protein